MISALRSLLLLAGLSLFWAAPAHATDRKTAKKATKAAKAADGGDYEKAIVLGLEVLDADPSNLDAAWAVGCGAAMLVLSGQVAPDGRDTLVTGAVALLTIVENDASDPVRAAMARGLITDLTGNAYVLPRPEPTCSNEALLQYAAAEAMFGKGQMEAARALYEQAIAACPTNATWIVYMGDTWMDIDTAPALAAYDRALAIDPCHPQGHRFAADVLMRAETVEGVLRGREHALAAVACDPTYDEGWATYAIYVKAEGQAVISRSPAAADAEGYKVYQDALAATPGDDPLKRRETAIREVFKQGPPETPLWTLLLDASGKGMLEEAILFELLDEELGPLYLEQRVARLERLSAYVVAEHVTK